MKQSTRLDYEARISDAVAWLSQHATDDVSPHRLAKVTGFSPFHFHRVFRGVTGESVMQCHRRLRLESAALRLRRTREPVTQVALAAGFQSHEGFTRAFKEHFGQAPTTWRKQASARVRALAARAPLVLEVTSGVTRRRSSPTAFVCLRGKGSFDEVGAAWQTMIEIASGEGLFTGDEQLVGRYPDDPDVTPPGKVRFDVGFVPRDGVVPRRASRLRREVLPGGLWAVAVHRGSYATLSDTYLRLVGGWFPHTGTILADRPCLELYLNHPAEVAEADLRTEVWAPIEERPG